MLKNLISRMRHIEISNEQKGDISARKVTIHEDGSMNGTLGAKSVVIKGIVNGIVRATKIIVRSTANVHGELQYETLIVDQGANFEAKCTPS